MITLAKMNFLQNQFAQILNHTTFIFRLWWVGFALSNFPVYLFYT